MKFTLFTEKTVSQCMSAINERMQAKPTSSRPGLDGWVEKSGRFAMAATYMVAGRFARKTVLKAEAERQSGVTTITGNVPSGAAPKQQIIIFVAVLLVALLLLTRGLAVPAIIIFLAGLVLQVPLMGDYNNSILLVNELRKTLKAKDTPPKKKGK